MKPKQPAELLRLRPPTKQRSYCAGWSWFEALQTHTDAVIMSGMFSKWESRPLGCARSDLRVTSAFRQAAEDRSASGRGGTVSGGQCVSLSNVLKWNLKRGSTHGKVNFLNLKKKKKKNISERVSFLMLLHQTCDKPEVISILSPALKCLL